VSQTILLDAGPLGLVTNPKRSTQSTDCAKWLQKLVDQGHRVIVPEIADYEVRRELLRASKIQGITRLGELINLLEYLPLNTATMRQAAVFWALARQQGQPTAGDKTIDADMILVAQVVTLDTPNVVIATTNIGHLSRFVAADLWQNISVG
jgi:hypothetical protein